jgi:hypothetical protein
MTEILTQLLFTKGTFGEYVADTTVHSLLLLTFSEIRCIIKKLILFNITTIILNKNT